MATGSRGFRFGLILIVILLAWSGLLQPLRTDHTSPGIAALASALPPPEISGEAAVVLDGRNGDILYQKNAHAHYAPASITKIATAIVALDAKGDQLDARIPVDFDSYDIVLNSNGTVMGLKPGDEPTLRDLLYGLMLPSGADAAVAIARYVGGGQPTLDPSATPVKMADVASSPAVQRFVDMMNEKMRALGLVDSHFGNPHGLDARDHYSSAYDMAVLSFYGMQNPNFRDLAGAIKYQVSGPRPYDVWNLNRLLYSYDGADGIKIGYTENALETIVASATRGPFKLIVSVMYSNYRYGDARALMDYYFDELANGTVARAPIPTFVPTPTQVPTPASIPMPTSTPGPLDPTSAVVPVSEGGSPTPVANHGGRSGLSAVLGDILHAIGLGK